MLFSGGDFVLYYASTRPLSMSELRRLYELQFIVSSYVQYVQTNIKNTSVRSRLLQLISTAVTLFSGSDARSFCHNKQISPGVSGAAIFMNCIVLELC